MVTSCVVAMRRRSLASVLSSSSAVDDASSDVLTDDLQYDSIADCETSTIHTLSNKICTITSTGSLDVPSPGSIQSPCSPLSNSALSPLPSGVTIGLGSSSIHSDCSTVLEPLSAAVGISSTHTTSILVDPAFLASSTSGALLASSTAALLATSSSGALVSNSAGCVSPLGGAGVFVVSGSGGEVASISAGGSSNLTVGGYASDVELMSYIIEVADRAQR